MNQKEYIHNMLVYWDPWGLITFCAAPENEYDSYISEMESFVLLSKYNEIYANVLNIFSQEGMPTEYLQRSCAGIAEGLSYIAKYNK